MDEFAKTGCTGHLVRVASFFCKSEIGFARLAIGIYSVAASATANFRRFSEAFFFNLSSQ